MVDITESQIMKKWNGTIYKQPLVSIRCMVYNHEKYIEQCLDGFLKQITNFPFEVIVHDDCSTDNSAKIIREYEKMFPSIVKPIYEKENQYSKGNEVLFSIIMPRMSGVFIAFCEGDDYWIDEHKLQKQVDYMLEHVECGLCFTDYNILYNNKNKLVTSVLKEHGNQYQSDYTLEEWIIKAGYVGPMTWLYRKDVFESYKSIKSVDGTFVQFAHFLAVSKVYCMKKETTAVYRVLEESASHSKNIERVYARSKDLYNLKLEMIKRYNLPAGIRETVNKRYYGRYYKIIAMMNDTEEIEKAMYYNQDSMIKKFILLLSKIKPFRLFLISIWRVRQGLR